MNFEQQTPAPFQEVGEWTKVLSKSTWNKITVQSKAGGLNSKAAEYACEECEAELESK